MSDNGELTYNRIEFNPFKFSYRLPRERILETDVQNLVKTCNRFKTLLFTPILNMVKWSLLKVTERFGELKNINWFIKDWVNVLFFYEQIASCLAKMY